MTPTMIILGRGDIGGVNCNINYAIACFSLFSISNRGTFTYKLGGIVLN
jgi:hypothetical protein